jgi:hypothetical protein
MSIDPELSRDDQVAERSWALIDSWRAVSIFDPLTMCHLAPPPPTTDRPVEHFCLLH